MANGDATQEAMRRIAKALHHVDVPYAIAGALAVRAHGHPREASCVEVLLTAAGLAHFRERWLGHGWEERFRGSRGLRDTVADVIVNIVLTGEFPGDRRPSPVPFPDPADATQPGEDGVSLLPLQDLLELKIASQMSRQPQPQDAEDAVGLIAANGLTEDYAEELDPYVEDEYARLWKLAQSGGTNP
jgi:hypothetical protein